MIYKSFLHFSINRRVYWVSSIGTRVGINVRSNKFSLRNTYWLQFSTNNDGHLE